LAPNFYVLNKTRKQTLKLFQMKKSIKLLCISALLFLAQEASAQADYSKGDVLLNAGIGLGYYYAGGTPIVFSVEFAVSDVFSIGPYLGFTSYSHHWVNNYRYTFIDFGVRGSYHFSKHLNLNTNKLDLYGAALLGYVAASYSDRHHVSGYYDPYPSGVRGGLVGGVRYYFSSMFSVNGEVGYGISPVLVGMSFKL
jgi:hypothetical protein